MTDNDSADPIRRYMRRNLDRRTFIRQSIQKAGGLAIGGSLLAGCNGADRGAADSKVDASKAIRISNWPLYIDPSVVSDFEKATGIRATYTEDINDNNEFLSRINEPLARGQSIDREIIVLTDWACARLIRRGYVAPLDDSSFPNKVNLEDSLRGVQFDSGRRYSIPWMSGMVGIAYNPKRTGRDLTSVGDLFDPKFKGKVTMVTEMRDTFGLIMLGDGKDPAAATRSDILMAAEKIKRYRENGHIRAFTGNDYADDLAAGNIAVAVAWSGDIQGLAADNPDLRWIAPKEGGILFSDNMMIPKTSDRISAAMAWINYVYDPAVSAKIVKAAPFISPVKGCAAELAKTAPELASSPLVNPPADLRSRLHVFRTLDDAEDQEFSRIFQDAIGA